MTRLSFLLFLCLLAGPLRASGVLPELALTEFFRLPVGQRGLEPTARLISLNGKAVRLTGWLVRRPEAGDALLLPHPVLMGHDDDGLADDLPPATVFLKGRVPATLPETRPVTLTGILSVGPMQEADGRFSLVRLFCTEPR